MKHSTTRVRLLSYCLAFALASGAIAQAQSGNSQPTQKKDAYGTDFLNALSSIPDWASRIQKTLTTQGSEIDRTKAKRALLPAVAEIQRNLSALEPLNRSLVDDMNQTPVNRGNVISHLQGISQAIFAMNDTFSSLRSSTQVLSIPELTELERAAEGLAAGKGEMAENTLAELGYKDRPTSPDARPVPADVKARSLKLMELLHKAQDSFGTLHQYLAS